MIIGPTKPISLSGKAQGGELILIGPLDRCAERITLVTTPGMPAEEALALFSNMAKNSTRFTERNGELIFEDKELKTIPGDMAFGGTEKGFNIPPALMNLSGYYCQETNDIKLFWENPSTGCYDKIAINEHGLRARTISGAAEKCTIECERSSHKVIENVNNIDFVAIGYKGDTPSYPASLKLSPCIQEEIAALPFIDGLAPNWTRWGLDVKSGMGLELSEAEKDDVINAMIQKRAMDGNTKHDGTERYYNYFMKPEDKPIMQRIFCGIKGNKESGLCRRFIGLFSGHTYRVYTRMNTLNMDVAKGNWSFSFHAAHEGTTNTKLTPDQMAGNATLPDGSKGKDAGLVARFSSYTSATNNQWLKVQTGPFPLPERISDITLPDGVTSITVWFRIESDTAMDVATDWIALEDLTCANALANKS
ncbi:MAG TPA: hypothetical protein PLI09_19055 [Candidatus Hydrogenedentes bacterium]|nr:hypothetical protein [Candidatus Hydrogenedentota bacterium]